MRSFTTITLSLVRIDNMRLVHKTIVLLLVGALVVLVAAYAVWDGAQ